MENQVVLVDYSTKVTKEGLDVGLALKKILVLAEQNTRDGVQVADLGAVVMGSFTELQEAMKNASHIVNEAKEEPLALSRSVLVPVTEGVEAWVKRAQSA